jgi:ACS family tartrate transporter-like MFS transporter
LDNAAIGRAHDAAEREKKRMDRTPGKRAVNKTALNKTAARLLPFLCLLYFINYIDRVNIGFAALTMNQDLGLTASVFGVGASMFFVGYVLCEVPSNIIMIRVGARRWIARIMISWGIVSASMSLVGGAHSFYAVRFLLGIAEAGFFPGIIFFLTQWFPAAHRARMIGLFMIGMPLSGVFGAPISTFILTCFDGLLGLPGWRWMFLVEAAPAILLGLACLRFLVDRPADATWLTPQERNWLETELDRERRATDAVRSYRVAEALMNPRVLLLCVFFFFLGCGLVGSVFWIPQIIRTFGLSTMAVGVVTMVPYVASVIAMVLWTRHSDATGERAWHVITPVTTSALGFGIAWLWLGTPVVAVLGLSLACVGIYATFPVFWTWPTSFLTGPAAAASVALITTAGNVAGIVAPAVIGWTRDATGGFAAAMAGLGVSLLIAAGLGLALAPRGPAPGRKRERLV